MSIIDQFSIGYRLKHQNKPKGNLNKFTNITKMSKKVRATKTFVRKGTLSADLANQLVTLGYNIDKLMCLLKNHPFSSVEEAVNLLEKNPDSGLYNHYFVKNENIKKSNIKIKNGSENLKTIDEDEECFICGGKRKEHIDEKDEFQKIVIESKKKYETTLQHHINKNPSYTIKNLNLENNLNNKNKNYLGYNSYINNYTNNNKNNGRNRCLNTSVKDNSLSPFNLSLHKTSVGKNINELMLLNTKVKPSKFKETCVTNEKINQMIKTYDDDNIELPKITENNDQDNDNKSIENNSIIDSTNNNLSDKKLIPKKHVSFNINQFHNKGILVKAKTKQIKHNEINKINENYQLKNFSFGDNLHLNNTSTKKFYSNKNLYTNENNDLDNDIITENIENNQDDDDYILNKKIQKFVTKEDLKNFNDPDICNICFERKVNKNNIAQQSCMHKFCDQCINSYLTFQITNGKVLELKCLMGGCPHIYTPEEIKANVSPEIFRKYRKFYGWQIKKQNLDKTYINCPFVDCEELVDVTNIPEGNVICGMGHRFCRNCFKIGGHSNFESCKKNDLNLGIIKELKKQNPTKVYSNYKQCPECGVLIEKVDGCNQMKCTNCEFCFCWLCLRKYTPNHYSIYNVKGCPGMRFESMKTYKIRNNCCLNCLWHTLSCLLYLLIFIFIYLFYLFCGCAYEFYRCYKTRNDKKNNDNLSSNFDSIDIYDNYNEDNGSNIDNRRQDIPNGENKNKDNKAIITLILCLGVLCQPLYLAFYAIFILFECYRRFGCMFYFPR